MARKPRELRHARAGVSSRRRSPRCRRRTPNRRELCLSGDRCLPIGPPPFIAMPARRQATRDIRRRPGVHPPRPGSSVDRRLRKPGGVRLRGPIDYCELPGRPRRTLRLLGQAFARGSGLGQRRRRVDERWDVARPPARLTTRQPTDESCPRDPDNLPVGASGPV
jgi:hypothetical protein